MNCGAKPLVDIARGSWALLLEIVSASPGGAEVPLEIAPTGHATVAVSGVFGERQFVFDSGAEGSAVYEDTADQAGLTPAGTERVQGQSGASDLPSVQLGAIMLDGHRTDPLSAVKLPRPAEGVPLACIVGLDVFGDRTIDFDLPRKRLSLFAPGDTIYGATNTQLVTSRATIPEVRVGSKQLANAPVLVADLPVFDSFPC